MIEGVGKVDRPDRWVRAGANERRRLNRRDAFMILAILGAGIVLCFSAAFTCRDCGRRSESTEMMNHARMIGLGLYEFEMEYGRFPDASTISDVKKATGTNLTLTDLTSNDLFRQLVVTKTVESETCFGGAGRNFMRPDGIADNNTTALAAGECGFAYILGPASNDEPNRPLIFGPVMPGTKSIDLKACDHRVVVLYPDSSCRLEQVDDQGRIHLTDPEGDHSPPLLDPANSVWNGKPLEIKWPK